LFESNKKFLTLTEMRFFFVPSNLTREILFSTEEYAALSRALFAGRIFLPDLCGFLRQAAAAGQADELNQEGKSCCRLSGLLKIWPTSS